MLKISLSVGGINASGQLRKIRRDAEIPPGAAHFRNASPNASDLVPVSSQTPVDTDRHRNLPKLGYNYPQVNRQST